MDNLTTTIAKFSHAGLPCAVLRVQLTPQHGHLCGYVGISKLHPYYMKDWADNDIYDLVVHGGITYARSYLYDHGDTPSLWWLGFDCAHFGDPIFMVEQDTSEFQKYVENQCRQLAEQLAKLG